MQEMRPALGSRSQREKSRTNAFSPAWQRGRVIRKTSPLTALISNTTRTRNSSQSGLSGLSGGEPRGGRRSGRPNMLSPMNSLSSLFPLRLRARPPTSREFDDYRSPFLSQAGLRANRSLWPIKQTLFRPFPLVLTLSRKEPKGL